MSRVDYPQPIRDLVQHLKRLPGVGPRSAERIAIWMQREDLEFSQSFSTAINETRSGVFSCKTCGFFATNDGCAICSDSGRGDHTLCVVEQSLDVLALERTGAFKDQYHVLGGKLSPLHHVGPDDLRLTSLIERLRDAPFQELILALSNDVEGEATANYLADLLREVDVNVTRLAQGLPAGGGLENADELTLFRALNDRRAWNG